MTLASRIARANTTHFLSTEHFAESIAFYPGGSTALKSTIAGVWDADNLSGRNQIDGEGINLETRGGRRIRETIVIEISSAVGIDQDRDPPDVFKRVSTGEVAVLKRIAGSDANLVLVECVRNSVHSSRRPDRRG